MSKEQPLTMNRNEWEAMRYLEKKATFKQRYLELLELACDDIELDLL